MRSNPFKHSFKIIMSQEENDTAVLLSQKLTTSELNENPIVLKEKLHVAEAGANNKQDIENEPDEVVANQDQKEGKCYIRSETNLEQEEKPDEVMNGLKHLYGTTEKLKLAMFHFNRHRRADTRLTSNFACHLSLLVECLAWWIIPTIASLLASYSFDILVNDAQWKSYKNYGLVTFNSLLCMYSLWHLWYITGDIKRCRPVMFCFGEQIWEYEDDQVIELFQSPMPEFFHYAMHYEKDTAEGGDYDEEEDDVEEVYESGKGKDADNKDEANSTADEEMEELTAGQYAQNAEVDSQVLANGAAGDAMQAPDKIVKDKDV